MESEVSCLIKVAASACEFKLEAGEEERKTSHLATCIIMIYIKETGFDHHPAADILMKVDLKHIRL